MRIATLTRPKELDEYGTFGKLETDNFSCYTVELPWRENQRRISCIPEGEYVCQLRYFSDPSHKWYQRSYYEVNSVPGRSAIFIHIANFPSDIEGCIGLGKAQAVTQQGQKMITHSAKTINEFHTLMNGDDFILRIVRQ